MAFSKDVKFVDPNPIYARVQEELKSYFNTGSIDTLLFPIWTEDTLLEFGNTYLPIKPAVIDIFNFKAELPCDFKSVREVWVCGTLRKGPIQSPFTFYYQTDCRINPTFIGCSECNSPECNPNGCSTPTPVNVPLPNLCDLGLNNPNPCSCSTGDQFRVTHKVQTSMSFDITLEGMLVPGNYKTVNRIWKNSPNLQCSSINTFDIIGDSIVTSFNTGSLFLLYYAESEINQSGNYKIPDREKYKKYLYQYLRFMCYQILFDQSTDETFNQIKAKRDDAEHRSDEFLIEARTEAMNRTPYDVQKSIIRSYNRNRRFRIK